MSNLKSSALDIVAPAKFSSALLVILIKFHYVFESSFFFPFLIVIDPLSIISIEISLTGWKRVTSAKSRVGLGGTLECGPGQMRISSKTSRRSPLWPNACTQGQAQLFILFNQMARAQPQGQQCHDPQCPSEVPWNAPARFGLYGLYRSLERSLC